MFAAVSQHPLSATFNSRIIFLCCEINVQAKTSNETYGGNLKINMFSGRERIKNEENRLKWNGEIYECRFIYTK